ncbi:MAG: hypothetical protein QOJ06_2590 [Pseudonocardiales bacterium]|nr:hypothetical protein [Pseudonocardiales bacterium]
MDPTLAGGPITSAVGGAPQGVSRDLVELTISSVADWQHRSGTAVSHDSISRLWRRFGIQPWRCETFKFSTDPELEAKVRDVVGLYLNPSENAIVLSIDEKSQIQALDRTAPMLPMRPGIPERQTHDYRRHGTTTLFAALEIATGKVADACYRWHRHQEFLKFLNRSPRPTRTASYTS